MGRELVACEDVVEGAEVLEGVAVVLDLYFGKIDGIEAAEIAAEVAAY